MNEVSNRPKGIYEPEMEDQLAPSGMKGKRGKSNPIREMGKAPLFTTHLKGERKGFSRKGRDCEKAISGGEKECPEVKHDKPNSKSNG